MNFAPVTEMRFLMLVSVLAVQGSVRASEDYPRVVQWERTESETFVSKPNVIHDVDYCTVTIVSPNPGKREAHSYTDREIGNEARDCIDNDSNVQPKLAVMRPDLPGSFVCGVTKTLYVIPVIKVQLHRFFNVSLDFLKVRGTGENVKITRSNNLPPGLAFRVEPSGIVFVSGIIRAGIGTLVPRLTFRSNAGSSLYRIKIILHIEDSEPKENRTLVEIGMVPNRIDSGASDIQQQIKAVKCAASALSLNPWDLHGVNPEKEFTSTLRLRAYFESSENSCSSDPRKSIRCDDFSITKIVSDQTRCALDATNESLDRKPQTMETTEKSESEENYVGDVSDVRIEHNQIVTAAPISTTTMSTRISETTPTTRSPSSTTTTAEDSPPAASEETTASSPSSVPPKLEADVSREPKSLDSGSDSEVQSDSIPPTLLKKNEVSNQILDDAKLKTAVYGILGLAAIVVTIFFLFFFSKLELCKKKAGYDPVFMARMSDDNGKFA